MTIRPTPFYIISLFISLTSCIVFVLSAFQLYGDDDYVHNYLGCGPDGDTGAIPIMSAVLASMFFVVVHIIAHIVFLLVTKAKTRNKDFKVKLGFYKDEKNAAWFIKLIFYLFAIFLTYDYISTFYKFYFFEFVSFIVMTLTVLVYSLTISNLIGTKEKPSELNLGGT